MRHFLKQHFTCLFSSEARKQTSGVSKPQREPYSRPRLPAPYLLLETKPSHGTTVSWVETTKWGSAHHFNYSAIAGAVLYRTFTQHNEFKTFKRPVISLMLLAQAVSYRAWAQYRASTHAPTHPKALPLLMCFCCAKNKTGIWNAMQERYKIFSMV